MPANLPLERTSFVGRARELTELERLVGEAAIVTVVGTGGVGKTRLALQAARRLADRFPAGTWLADLGPIGSADLAATEVARLAGVLPGSGDPVQLLVEQLGDRRVLLLLDNCEHLVEAVALLAHRLVTACPNLRVLATSREPLAVGPEVTLELPPLETGEAVRLFVDRATAVDPAFAATDADGPLIEQLCGRLDSVPLVIELAAPWVRLFSPAELLPRLADRFELLAATRRDLPPRQRTMGATVDWSHQLLPEEQRVLFRRLATFSGSFGLEAAERVAGLPPLEPRRVGALLAGLRERSMVVVERTPEGASRYRLLETLKDFAAERLCASGEEPDLRRRHFAHHLERAERVDRGRQRTGADAEVATLVPDADDCRAALAWSIEADPAGALRLAAALEGFWMIRSVVEGRRWLQRALDRAPGPTRHRARALMVSPLVVGAGPTGLLLAGLLARGGVAVRIVDKRAGRSTESRALAVHARALELLDSVGLADEFVAHGQRVGAFSMWDGGRRLARIDFGVLDSAFPFLLDIPQSQTEAILRGYLARLGMRVEDSTEVLRVAPGHDGVEVATRGGDGRMERLRVPYLVGCDGAHSTVRRQVGLPFEGHGYPEDWLLADVALDWDRPPGEVHVVFHRSGRATVCMPMRDGRWRVILYFAGGQGLNTGLLEARDLAWKLAAVLAEGAPERLLDSYGAERGPVASQVVGLSHRLVRLSAISSPWARAARGVLLPLLTQLPPVRARAARRMSQLSIRYRPSPLSEANRRRGRGSRPGDRAPDAGGLCFHGEVVRLHRLLRGPGHTLLLLAGAPAEEVLRRLRPYGSRVRPLIVGLDGTEAPDGLEVVRDLTGETHRKYRGNRCHLVRPDGHLAASGADAIQAYLTRVYGTRPRGAVERAGREVRPASPN